MTDHKPNKKERRDIKQLKHDIFSGSASLKIKKRRPA